eukprot:2181205-Amphidinium_carterae.1
MTGTTHTLSMAGPSLKTYLKYGSAALFSEKQWPPESYEYRFSGSHGPQRLDLWRRCHAHDKTPGTTAEQRVQRHQISGHLSRSVDISL